MARNSEECFVYVIGTFIDGEFSSPSKVGVSHSPQSRLITLRTSAPFRIELAHSFLFHKRDMALNYEGHVHEFFQKNRMVGEWFDLPALEIVDYIADDLHEFITSNWSGDVAKRLCDTIGLTAAYQILAGEQ